jgi:ethanolamine utilization protein EutQ
MKVTAFNSDRVETWWQRGEQRLYLGDVVDHTTEAAMSVGFARYRKGEANPWTVTYDEALIVTKGAFTVRTADGAASARAGEVIYLPAGTELVYQADEDTELVYVSHPHWFEATEASPHKAKLAEFAVASTPPEPIGPTT